MIKKNMYYFVYKCGCRSDLVWNIKAVKRLHKCPKHHVLFDYTVKLCHGCGCEVIIKKCAYDTNYCDDCYYARKTPKKTVNNNTNIYACGCESELYFETRGNKKLAICTIHRQPVIGYRVPCKWCGEAITNIKNSGVGNGSPRRVCDKCKDLSAWDSFYDKRAELNDDLPDIPDCCTLEELSSVFGMSKQRLGIVERLAMVKFMRRWIVDHPDDAAERLANGFNRDDNLVEM